MSCCTSDGTGNFFSKSADYYARKFRRRGLDRAQKLLQRSITNGWQPGRSLLDIGCGTGGLHLALLKSGAGSAFGIDLSERMVLKAKELAGEMGLSDRVKYLAGDFGTMEEPVPSAEIVILDKVVCCYNEPFALLARAAAKCEDMLAVSYPRDALLARWSFKLQAFIGETLHWAFHPMYHEPSQLEAAVASFGFTEIFSCHTPIWEIKGYRKSHARDQQVGNHSGRGAEV